MTHVLRGLIGGSLAILLAGTTAYAQAGSTAQITGVV